MSSAVVRPNGRPKIHSPHSQLFLSLYCDPLQSPLAICQAMSISLKTFYRYENELNLPKLRVGVMNHSGMPRLQALHQFRHPDEKYELGIVRALAFHLKVRIKLIPCESSEAEKLVQEQSVEFIVAAIAATKERKRELYLSNSYDDMDRPQGAIFGLKKPLPTTQKEKPRLGVWSKSIHKEFAEQHLAQDYKIISYHGNVSLFEALRNGKVENVLVYPEQPHYFPQFSHNLIVQSKPYFYDSHSTIVFHRDSAEWLPEVNQALERLQETKTLRKITNWAWGLPESQ